jgi:hypothetical protein
VAGKQEKGVFNLSKKMLNGLFGLATRKTNSGYVKKCRQSDRE